jgi:hypothetical protein
VPKVPRSLSGAIRFIDADRPHIHPLLDTVSVAAVVFPNSKHAVHVGTKVPPRGSASCAN